MFETIYEPIVQLGYSLQQSQIFTLYSWFVFILGVGMIFMMCGRCMINRKLSAETTNSRKTFYNDKMSTREYEKAKSQLTRIELRKLEQSPEYKQYLRDKCNPMSIFNCSKIEPITSDIEFSDEQEQKTQTSKISKASFFTKIM